MPDEDGDAPHGLTVGSRVRVTSALNAEGVIVEDCGDLAGVPVRVDENLTVTARRWAIALDDGQLVFHNSDVLELAP